MSYFWNNIGQIRDSYETAKRIIVRFSEFSGSFSCCFALCLVRCFFFFLKWPVMISSTGHYPARKNRNKLEKIRRSIQFNGLSISFIYFLFDFYNYNCQVLWTYLFIRSFNKWFWVLIAFSLYWFAKWRIILNEKVM